MLNTPGIIKFPAFDPSHDFNLDFIYSGNQIFKNQLVIIDNSTYQTVYDNSQKLMRQCHIIPANTLSPGKAYLAKIKVFDNSGDESEFSSPTLFYCYSSPSICFVNISDNMIHTSASIDVGLDYKQKENEAMKECVINLYSYDFKILSSSSTIYDSNKLRHTFYGLKDELVYYIRAYGKTLHDLDFDTGYIKVNVKYTVLRPRVVFEVKNHPELGSVSMSTGIIDVGFKVENDNYSFSNGEVTLHDNTLIYDYGFSAPSEYAFFAKARNLKTNIPFVNLKTASGKQVYLLIRLYNNKYYCVLNAPYALGIYNISKKLPDGIDYNNTLVVYEIRYRNGTYNLDVYTET